MFAENVKFFQKAIILHPAHDRFLTLRRTTTDTSHAGKWDLPGGGVEFGENHLHSIIREIQEETALSIGELKVLEVATWFDPETNIYRIFVGHWARATNDQVVLSPEHTAYQWVTGEEYRSLPAPNALKRLTERLGEVGILGGV